MKMTRLLEVHHKFESAGLPGSFGDGYLMTHNSIFSSIRKHALYSGYSFSNERDQAYETFPLVQLNQIIRTRVIPYSNNVVALEQLAPSELSALNWEDVDGNLKKNFVFHEACHCWVRQLTEAAGVSPKAIELKSADISSQRSWTFRMLFEESCSNAAELLGLLDVNDQIHRRFYEMNSYICEFENSVHLRNAKTEFGQEFTVQFLILSYLHANFLRNGVDEKSMMRILEILKQSPFAVPQMKFLRGLAKVAFHLSERFRIQTTSFHLRMAGVHTPSRELFDFDFLMEFQKDPGSLKVLQQFAKSI